MTRLILVRHAMPVVEPEVPAEDWELGTREEPLLVRYALR